MRAVERSTDVPADAADVWFAVVSGDWLGDEADLDARVGGEGVVRDGGHLRHVVVEAVDPGRRLVYRWWPLTPDGVGAASRVDIGLEPAGAATRVIVVETPLPPATPLPSAGPLALAYA